MLESKIEAYLENKIQPVESNPG
jgi:hypothetical protein